MTEKDKIEAIGWNFDNSYSKLPKVFFTTQNPAPSTSPNLVILNESLTAFMGLNVQALKSDCGTAELSGNSIPDGSLPIAEAYAGHQFGHFTMLGDGRAVLLGEHITPLGDRVDIQLKGSGRTPYSRGGDGRAVLGPMLREYIISEAMYGLNIPTTRSLAVVTTGDTVVREAKEIGAILTRVASSHIRVGTFQYASQYCSVGELQVLADYTLKRHFKEPEDEENRYLFLLKEVVKRQAALISKWQLVGFIHGVMNTDNMALSGETIDYGPCAFMDVYDPATVFSSIDTYGRYAYGNQPQIAAWNLARFAETLLPLLNDNMERAVELAQEAVTDFIQLYNINWLQGMRAKLGIFNEESVDEALMEGLLGIMKKHNADYTNTFRALTIDEFHQMKMFDSPEFKEWYKQWQERVKRQHQSKEASMQLMRAANPAVLPRNHRVEEALEAAKSRDYSVMNRLLNVLKNPYGYTPEQAEYAKMTETSSCPYRTFCGT